MDALSTYIGVGRRSGPADSPRTRTRRPRLSTIAALAFTLACAAGHADTVSDRNASAFEKQPTRIALSGVATDSWLAGLSSAVDRLASRSVEPAGREAYYDPLLSEPGNVCAPAVAIHGRRGTLP